MDDEFCPFCECNPCDCNWGNFYGNFEEGQVDIVQVPVDECDGDVGGCGLPTLTDFGSSIFDCVSGFSGYPRDSLGREHNSNILNKLPNFKIGDLVKWYSIHGKVRHKRVWVIKRVLHPSLIDSGWYDYEITDGRENHMVTKYELFRVPRRDSE